MRRLFENKEKKLGTTWKSTQSRQLQFYLSKIKDTLEPLTYIIFKKRLTLTVVSDFRLIRRRPYINTASEKLKY